MSRFISYSNLSSSFATFTSQLASIEIQEKIQEALEILKWKEVFREEMRELFRTIIIGVLLAFPAGKLWAVSGCLQ
jgi:hypothetical protein